MQISIIGMVEIIRKQQLTSMKKLMFAAAATLLTSSAFAGGHLTNTNQSISFLRNPARNAAIGIDGVYSNPAGVAFLNEGFHLNLNIQSAYQTREVTTTNEFFAFGQKNGKNPEKFYKGTANAPVIPSFQAAYNTGKWSFQAGFGIIGGGGKCEFSNGLGSFEGYVGAIDNKLMGVSKFLGSMGISAPAVNGYDVDGYMQGRQYYFGLQLGAAYKINEHISVYGGARVLYGDATYKAKLENIRVVSGTDNLGLMEYFEDVESGIQNFVASQAANIVNNSGNTITPETATEMVLKSEQAKPLTELEQQKAILGQYANGVNLQSDQTGWGIAPIIGIDYRIGQFNFSGRYEFKTRMRMKNKSTVKEASVIPAVNKFADGTSVPEDQPALLALGAQWSPLSNLRIDLGWHLFFDKAGHLYQHQEKLLSGDTNEYLAGIEWDPIKKLTVSGGVQITRYGLSDAFMNDMSFVVNSWSFGFGAKWQINKTVAVEAAYFQTNYGNYNRTTPAATVSMGDATMQMPEVKDKFHRTNRVFGIGTTLNF